MDANTIERLRREHVRCCPGDTDSDEHTCLECDNPWPCDIARLLEVLTPEVVAVAELMELGVSFRKDFFTGPRSRDWMWVGNNDPICYNTPTKLLAAVKAALEEVKA